MRHVDSVRRLSTLNATGRFLMIAALALLVVCMVPMMGPSANASGHFHHDASSSCATCMGNIAAPIVVFSLSFLGFLILFMPSVHLLVLAADRFHPPYGF